jgi:hypothetical protein
MIESDLSLAAAETFESQENERMKENVDYWSKIES